MYVKNPCTECIVRAICTDTCDEFVGYLASYEWVKKEMQSIMSNYPTSFKEIALYLRDGDRNGDRNGVILGRLYDLRENVRIRKIL